MEFRFHWIGDGMFRGRQLVAVDCVSVDPGYGNPLRSVRDQVHGFLQQANGVVDFVVDNGLIKIVSVGVLQHLRFLLESLKRVVLSYARGDGWGCNKDNIGSKLCSPEDL